MKYLVTGTSGFLGQDVVERLVAAGHDVIALGRHDARAGKTQSQYQFFKADITDIETLRACRKQHPDIDVLVHLAALVPKTKDEDVAREMCNVNVCGTINLLEVFGEDLQHAVYASTAEVYGLPSHDGLISENMLPKPLSNYGASKLAGELFCEVYGARHDLPISMLRFTVLYGPGDAIQRAVPNFIKKALNGESLEIFGGEELRDYLNVEDAARAVYLAGIKPARGVFNIGTGKGITIKETAEKIIAAVNPELSANVLPREKKAADIVLDVARARTELGFKAKYTFPDLIEKQITWHKKH